MHKTFVLFTPCFYITFGLQGFAKTRNSSTAHYNTGAVRAFQGIRKQYSKQINRICPFIWCYVNEKDIEFNKALDIVEGFEDLGNIRVLEYATGAVVYMAAGLTKKWKVPLALWLKPWRLLSSCLPFKKYYRLTSMSKLWFEDILLFDHCFVLKPNLGSYSKVRFPTTHLK